MEKIYVADEETRKSVKNYCFVSKNWKTDKRYRVLFLTSIIGSISIYGILMFISCFLPEVTKQIYLNIINEFSFIFILIIGIGLTILIKQCCTMQCVSNRQYDQLVFSEDGITYRYLNQKDKIISYLINYRNVKTISYNKRNKHLIMTGDYLYFEKPFSENGFPWDYPSIPFIADNMKTGALAIPMCFNKLENILINLSRTTGVDIEMIEK